MNIKKTLAGIIAAFIASINILSYVSADSVFDEVYENYYYSYFFATGKTKEYCLSSDSSLEGYIEIDINGNSQRNSSARNSQSQNLSPKIINQAYIDLSSISFESNNTSSIISNNEDVISNENNIDMTQNVIMEDTRNFGDIRTENTFDILSSESGSGNTLSEMTSYDQSVVRLLITYDGTNFIGGSAFIIQDWDGKSCLATAAHNVVGTDENGNKIFPQSVRIQIFDRASHAVKEFYADSVHVSEIRMEKNPNPDEENTVDYALLTVDDDISLADTYGRIYLATIGESARPDVELRGLSGGYEYSDVKMYHSFGNVFNNNNKLFYCYAQAQGGMSGGPMIMTAGGNEFAIGIIGSSAYSDGQYTSNGVDMRWSVTRFLAFNPFLH